MKEQQKNIAQETEMQLRRLTLFSSGVGFFQHSGDIAGNAEFALPFNKDAVNDALKSIVINDPDAMPFGGMQMLLALDIEPSDGYTVYSASVGEFPDDGTPTVYMTLEEFE